MKKHRIIVVFALLLILASALPALAKETITYWLWLDDPTDRTVHELVDEFNAQHLELEVKIETLPLSDYYDQLMLAIGSGAGPDAARFKDWWLGAFYDAELLVDLQPFVNNWPGADDVVEALWSTGKIPGEDGLYMMPHQYITFYLYYRADLFRQAGLEPPNDFDDFLNAAKTLTDTSERKYGFGLRGGDGGQDQWLAFMAAGGARLVDEYGDIVVNSPEAVKINQWYIDLLREHAVAPPSSPTDAYSQVLGAFQAGNTAMMAHHVGSSVMMQEQFGDDVGVIPIPALNPEERGTMGTMSGNVVFSTSDANEAAFEFIAWLSEAEAMDKWSKSRQGQLPVLESVAAQPYYVDNEFFKVSLEGGEYAVLWPPLPGVGYVASYAWKSAMQRALLGEISSQQMLDEIAEALLEK